MKDFLKLKNIIELLLSKKEIRPEDRGDLHKALSTGEIVLSDNDIDVNGNVNQSIIIIGSGNTINYHINDSQSDQLKKIVFPANKGVLPPFPRLLFVGRESDLIEVKDRILNRITNKNNQNILVIRGWPGVGKTSLINFLARSSDLSAQFSDGVFWTSLGKSPVITDTIKRWSDALGLNHIGKLPTLNEMIENLRQFVYEKNILYIIDDLWDINHFSYFNRIAGLKSKILITTRLNRIADEIAYSKNSIYNLEVLNEKDSLRLFKIITSDITIDDENFCKELIHELENLPLSIHVAGKLIRKEVKIGSSLELVLKEIKEGKSLLKANAPADREEDGIIPSVQALLKKSTDVLDENTRYDFSCLSLFKSKPATFDVNALKALWDKDDIIPILREIVGLGLLEIVGDGRYQMHDILVKHAKSLFDS
jgi:hypothetical protein